MAILEVSEIAAEYCKQERPVAWNRLRPTMRHACLLAWCCHHFRHPTGRRHAGDPGRATEVHEPITRPSRSSSQFVNPRRDLNRIAAGNRDTTD